MKLKELVNKIIAKGNSPIWQRQTTEDANRFFTTQQRYRIGIDSFTVVVDRTTNNMYLQGRGTLSPFYDSEGRIYKYSD